MRGFETKISKYEYPSLTNTRVSPLASVNHTVAVSQAPADEHILTILVSFYLVLVHEILVRDC